jgi:hypothetical protein
MHVLAIYSVNEHISELMAEAAAQRLINEAKAAKSKGSRFAFLTSRFPGRAAAVAAASPTKVLAGS